MNPRNVRFTESVHMTDKYQVYVCHIWSTARFLAFLVSAARRDVSDLDCLRILSVFATKTFVWRWTMAGMMCSP